MLVQALLQHFSVERDANGKVIWVNDTIEGTDLKNMPFKFRYHFD